MANSQVFISYSRRNFDFVQQLITDLKQLGFDIWLDKEDLEVGTASWERAIRTAIKEAGAVILVASPDALASDYVQGELTLAKLYHRSIYPIWADGESWMECVPLDMANYQYVDGRGDAYNVAIEAIRLSLAKEFDLSEGTIKLGLPTHETIDLNMAQFSTGFDLLSYVWINYLQGWYEPFTYGKEWIVANVHTKQIAIPYSWLTINPQDTVELNRHIALISDVMASDLGIQDGTYWAIWDARRLKAFGVCTNDDTVRADILRSGGEGHLNLLRLKGDIQRKSVSDVSPENYKHQFVVATFTPQDDRMCFVDT